MGQRMKSYGVKSLINIMPRLDIITHQLNIIRKTFINCEIILITGFESEKLMRQTPNDIIKIKNERFEETNVMKSIGIGLHAATTDNILIVYGDLVFNQQALQIPIKESAIVIDKNTMTTNEVGCNVNNDGYVEYLMYDRPNKWAQIILLKGRELDLMREMAWEKDNDNLYGFEVLNSIIEKGGRFKAIVPSGIKANDIDSSKDLQVVKRIL